MTLGKEDTREESKDENIPLETPSFDGLGVKLNDSEGKCEESSYDAAKEEKNDLKIEGNVNDGLVQSEALLDESNKNQHIIESSNQSELIIDNNKTAEVEVVNENPSTDEVITLAQNCATAYKQIEEEEEYKHEEGNQNIDHQRNQTEIIDDNDESAKKISETSDSVIIPEKKEGQSEEKQVAQEKIEGDEKPLQEKEAGGANSGEAAAQKKKKKKKKKKN
jgi:hypothetical protein